ALPAGTRVVLFVDGGADPPEEKEVEAVRVEDDRVVVRWREAVRGDGLRDARAFCARRTFRVFGHDSPATFMTPSSVAGRVNWSLSTLSDWQLGYPLRGALTTLELDALHDGLAPGR